MLTKHTHKDIVWIDLETPTNEEVRSIMNDYNIHPIVANELLSPTLRSRVDAYDNFVYLILHFPTIIHSHDGKTEQEIDFIVGKNFIITAHYGVVDVLREFSKILEVDTVLDKDRFGKHGGFVFYYMLRHLYHHMVDELDHVSKMLGDIEKRIFNGQEHEMVRKISDVSRKLLNFKKAVGQHRGVLQSFEVAGKKLFGDDFEYYLRAISEEYYKASVNLESYFAILAELRITNDSMLNTKTNDIIRVLTIMAFVTFPLSLFASLFGMNTAFLPFVGMPNDFWIIIGIMVVATVGFFSYFKHKKWL